MEILEYDDVEPVSVLNLNMLALDFPLTPKYVAHIRHSDPQPFPFLAVFAVEDSQVLEQVGVLRLPMISSEGPEDVGGVWALYTHPQHSGQRIASPLLDGAHNRMREAGLRFSALGPDRYRVAHKLYRRHGYEETNVWGTSKARWETAHQPTRLRTKPPGSEGHEFVEKIFRNISKDYLGFAWRHTSFSRLDRVRPKDLWIVWNNTQPVGYAIALTWLYNGTKGSLLLVAIMHAASNTAGMFLPITSTVSSEIMDSYSIFVLLEVVAAIIVVFVAGPAQLSRTNPNQIQE